MKKSVLASRSSQSSREHKQVGMNHRASGKVNGEWLLHRGRSLNDPSQKEVSEKRARTQHRGVGELQGDAENWVRRGSQHHPEEDLKVSYYGK